MTYYPKARFVKSKLNYPESDGQPMADNTLQFEYIVRIKTNLEILYREEEVFVAGDLFWYPVEGKPRVVVAPDVMVAFDRPKGYRGSYKQWEEEDKAPDVVFEVLSQSNTTVEMIRKMRFYERHGVKEFIIIDPYQCELVAYVRQEDTLEEVEMGSDSWKSQVLNITIEGAEESVNFYFPDGHPFHTPEEWNELFRKEKEEKKEALQREEQALQREKTAIEQAEQERLEKEAALQELERLKAELAKLKQ
ncbi:MAG: Uma2 family endonuclease [Bacteroidota bacterium]